MTENELKELVVERVVCVPAGSTLVFELSERTTESECQRFIKMLGEFLPGHKCLVLRDAKLRVELERPML